MMNKNVYMSINKFECCGIMMVTVIMKDKAACVMSESEYNRIIGKERKIRRKDKLKIVA